MKKILIIVMVLFCFNEMNAQTGDDLGLSGGQPTSQSNYSTRHKPFKFSAGFKAGVTFTSMSGTPNEGEFYDKSGVGFDGGVVGNFRFGFKSDRSPVGTGLLGCQIEAIYKMNAVKTLGDDDLSIGYFEVPMLLQVYPFYKVKGFNNVYLEVGPDIAGTMSKSPETISVKNTVSYKTGDLKGFDVRVAVGGGMYLPSGLGFGLRYYLGTSDLAGNFPCKMNSLEVSLSYLFPIIKDKK